MTVTTTAGPLAESGKPPRYPFPLAELQDTFDIGTWQSVTWIRGGKNEHAAVITERSTFFLRRSYRAKTVDALQWQIELLATLRSHGLPVPVPQPCRNGGHVAEFDGRLYGITEVLPGAPFDADRVEHLQAMARMLAGYHALVPALGLRDPDPAALSLLDTLSRRFEHVEPADAPQLYARARGIEQHLGELWPDLPVTVLHGGCRRGSMLFTGAEISGLLDFDSARFGPRVLDVATAAHDVSKIYTESGRDDHKVVLDLDRISIFLDAYRETGTLSGAELAAIPLMIEAKRARRALGRVAKLGETDRAADEAQDDADKIALEGARLAWLAEHADEIRAACAPR